MSRRLRRKARRAAASRHLPRAERKQFARELEAHLDDSAEVYSKMGLPRKAAEKRALKDFGDVRKTRIDLGRAWRGKRVVLFPDAPGEHLASLLIYNLKAIVLIVAIVVILRWQVVAAYQIPTKSMEPTLRGDPAHGDKILVNKLYYRLYDAERWEIAVFERNDYEPNLIKRIAGLSGETVDIRHGDLYIDGEIARKPPKVEAALLVPVFKDNRDLASELWGRPRVGLLAWETGEENSGTWTETEGAFRSRVEADGLACLEYARPILDVYPGGSAREDAEPVGDLAVRFMVRADAGCKVVGVELREGRDRFELEVPVEEKGPATLTRNGAVVFELDSLRLEAGKESSLTFSNIDDVVTVSLNGKSLITFEVPVPEHAGDPADAGAMFGFRGGGATFREVELLRDIHYRATGRLPMEVPEGHYFMLGDNSANSDDSRNWGTITEDQLIGRPIFVFWPVSRLKLVR